MYAGTDPLTRRPIRLRATARTETQARIELGKFLERARDGRSPEAGVSGLRDLHQLAALGEYALEDLSERQPGQRVAFFYLAAGTPRSDRRSRRSLFQRPKCAGSGTEVR
jgi:hypothetical protein